jgi:hypothetical protein
MLVERLRPYVELGGARHLAPGEAADGSAHCLELFAQEVASALRELASGHCGGVARP